MRSTLLAILFFSVAAMHLPAQGQRSDALQSLIDTELAFAKFAKVQNTRDAFLQYLSDETVMFMDAGISVGKKTWQNRKPDSTLLIWEPVFADISASGDFGYTTGPSEYYPTRRQGEQAFYGSYITIWKKEKGAGWKMALDIGIYPQPKPTSKSLNTPPAMSVKKSESKRDHKQDLMKQEMLFIKAVSANAETEYRSFVANESRYLRAGKEPVTDPAEIEKLIRNERAKVSYTPVEASVSSAGDMAYVYGKVKLVAPDKSTDGYYLRIYKRQNQKDWKIVLDGIHQ